MDSTPVLRPATRHDLPDLPETTAPLTTQEQTASASTAHPVTKEPPTSSILGTTTATKKLQTRRAASAASSPNPSRESSPVRPSLKSNTSAGVRSATRTNSSPSRPSSINTNPPSAAASQRALSATSTPSLHPTTSESTIKAPVPQKPSAVPEIRETPRWPVSPRLRSPPPQRPSILSPRKIDQEVPSINVQRSSLPTDQQEGYKAAADSDAEDTQLASGMRTPARGVSGASSTLETVQEISQPNTPLADRGLDGVLEKDNGSLRIVSEPESFMDSSSNKTIRAKPSAGANESGSESGGKGEIKLRSTSSAPPTGLRPSAPSTKSLSLGAGRGKAGGEGSTRNMTVETETVSSIPQVALGGTVGGPNGSIRAKPSSETIRPKKEKKKTARKAPSVTSGTASSKADIFEAKVASAVDEANSSDSEETFVYESNPPDVSDRPRRFHSRTPSATSMASQVDQRNGARAIMDGHHSVAMKKSMKFANSYNGPEPAAAAEDDGKATIRSNMGTGRGTTHHHHIGGRWNRNGGNGHPSLFDNESPFPNASNTKQKLVANTPRQSFSRPTSPRVTNMRMVPNGKRSPITSGYDLDDGADDERTPLMSNSVRSSRSNRRRPPGSSVRQLEHQNERDDRSCMSRVASCIVLTLMIVLVLSGVIGFIFATTQGLSDVKVVALKNVLASEQDIIFDMKVQARNPNLVVVTIDHADLVVFAKSKYAGTDYEWWKRPQAMVKSLRRAIRIRDDDPNDPPLGDDPTTNPNLEIGHVLNLDSPLTFEGSPFHLEPAYSMGQIRLTHPGNHTVPSGSERWGRVLQHEFDLIVRGTLKYSLPLSQRVRSIGVEGRITVQPNAADQDPDEVRINL